jgi:tRNA(fMet)-specific endonuclease VapC
MSRILLDTSAYAAFLLDHPGVKAEIREAADVFLSPIVLGELRAGFLRGSKPAENERRLADFLASPRCHVPAIDEETSHRYAAIHVYLRRQGTPVSPNDLWIAASAAQHGLRVVTLDGDFERIPQVLVTKLEPPARNV